MRSNWKLQAGILALILTSGVISGCQQEKKVIDIKTPGASIEVKKTDDSPKIEIGANK